MSEPQIVTFFQNVFSALNYLLKSDYSNFERFFPNTYLPLYISIRIVPVLALAFFLPHSWRLQLNGFFEKIPLKTFNSCNYFFIILAIAIGFRLWYASTIPLILSENDSMARLEQAQDWYNKPTGLPGGLSWLPLHIWLMGAPLLFKGNLFVGSRIITLVLGVATFFPLYFLTQKKFDTKVALLTCFLLAINPFHIKYSILPMSEVPFIFFTITALYLTFLYIETDKVIFLIFAGFCFNCANLIRFEGWLLSAITPFFLLYYRKKTNSFFFLAGLNSITIFLFGFICLLSTGDFLYGITLSDQEVAYNYSAIKDIPAHIKAGLSTDGILPLWFVVFIIYGGVHVYKRKLNVPWFLTALFLLAFVLWKLMNCSIEPAWRYFSTSVFLLLPFISLSIVQVAKISRGLTLLIVLGLFFLFIPQISGQQSQLKNQVKVPAGFFEAAAGLRKNKQANDKVIYDGKGFDYSGVRLLTKTPFENLYFAPPPGMKAFISVHPYNDSTITDTIIKANYQFIFYQTGSQTDSFLQKPTAQNSIASRYIILDTVYANQNYTILKIIHR